jgi:asparagine synthase (glutamine-hydrolysing)
VVEFANALPADWKLNILNEKFILKKAFRGQIPEEILTRPKQPYRAPSIIRTVLKRGCPLMDRYLSPPALASAGIFNPPVVGRLVDKLSQDVDGDVGNRDTMAFLAVLSTQIIHQHMISRLDEPRALPLTTANIGI